MPAQSPQLINSKTTEGKGYDAQKADVWACGVLLFVMMLGMFPFEHSDHPDPNSSQAHAEVSRACACMAHLTNAHAEVSRACACMPTLQMPTPR